MKRGLLGISDLAYLNQFNLLSINKLVTPDSGIEEKETTSA